MTAMAYVSGQAPRYRDCVPESHCASKRGVARLAHASVKYSSTSS